jgi:hypothetical protein
MIEKIRRNSGRIASPKSAEIIPPIVIDRK